ncbi:MAG: metal-dependent hydrolase [Acidimicrobiales bacterium]
MLGRDHAALGALVTLGVTRLAGLGPAETIAVTATVAGMALLPDIDEPGSTVAHLAEPFTGAVAWVTKRLAGGHRCATHSLLAVAASAGVAFACAAIHLSPGVLASVILVGLAYAIALRSLIPAGLRPGYIMALVFAAAATWATWTYVGFAWTLWAVPLGVALHLAGDIVTSSGVPLLWPSKHHYSIPLLGNTASLAEKIAGLAMLAGVAFLGYAPVMALLPTLATLKGFVP